MLFSDEFIESIANDPIKSTLEIITIIEKNLSNDVKQNYDVFLEGFSLISSILDNFNLTLPFHTTKPDLVGDVSDVAKIEFFFKSVKHEFNKKNTLINFNTKKNRFDALLNQSFSYEFSQGDLDRVQKLINELREEINSSKLFEEKHKSRLLKRLEKLQAELHKKMSDIDAFWGLVGDAGVAIGKFGKDAKPFVDLIKDITDIVWRTQSRAEELPSGTPTPLLENFDS